MKTGSEESKKNGERKNRFLLCFCPANDCSDSVRGKKPVGESNSGKPCLDPLLTYISVVQEELIPVIISPNSKRNQPVSAPQIEGTVVDSSLKRRRKIARILKAATFENRTRKVRTVKVQQDSLRRSIISDNGSSVLNLKLSDMKPAVSLPESTRTRRKLADKVSRNSCRHQFEWLTFSSSSTSSSSTRSKTVRSYSSSKSLSYRNKSLSATSGESKQSNQQTCVTRKFYPATGLSLLVISLSIMFLWGRVCAIVCTSTWLYLVPRREIVNSSPETAKRPENATEAPELSTRRKSSWKAS